ncbi:MAG: aminotransferase class I/II-fold pyridoxal phosphate-dependent enzyme [Deltaproteobacteria bacterium]|jgi:threonine-phosphate decarboxylase|nr:aminotransferase class I/II-fold pyridoxal phosphate-dependent enzyme [Deltaproteobacteria bacterium]
MLETVHGGRVEEAAQDLGLPIGEILDFSANINPLDYDFDFRAALISSLDTIHHYPDIRAGSLTEDMASQSGLPAWTIQAGSGSTPLIYQLARILKTENHIIVAPAFAEYGAALSATGIKKINYHLLSEENGFLLTQEDVLSVISKNPELVILANPANPTGLKVPSRSLSQFIEASNGEQGFWLVIDEAFMDFCQENHSLEKTILDNPRLIILKSLTKLFAIPGLRLGYLACGNRRLMDTFHSTTEPWSINSIAQHTGRFLLTKKNFISKTPEHTARLRERLVSNISPYVETFPSQANFVMGRLKRGNKSVLIKHLYKKGILVRDLDGMPGLPDGFIRLAVRPLSEISLLTKALEEYYA